MKTFKLEIKFYQKNFTRFKVSNLLPKISFSKNVQGWSFTKNYTITWLRFAITLFLIKRSDLGIDRNIAHLTKLGFKHKDYYQIQNYESVAKTVRTYGFIFGKKAIDHIKKHKITKIKWKLRIHYKKV